jgi:hypothetical protein
VSSEPTSSPAPQGDAPRPKLSSAPPRAGMSILRLVRPFALLALFAVVLGRAVGPAAAGIGVGMNRLIAIVDYAGKITSQLFVMLATIFAVSEILVASRSRLPAAVRYGAPGLGGVVILVSLMAAPRREILPASMVGLMALCAAVLALLSAASAIRAPFARAAALIVGLVGFAGAVRLLAVGLAYQAAEPGWTRLVQVARGMATVGFALELGAVFVATAWIAARARKLTSPVTLLVLALALVLTRQALRADLDDAGVGSLLLRRAAERLVSRPDPFFPPALSIFVAFLAPLAAGAVLLVRGAPPPRPGSEQPAGPGRAPVPPAIRAALALALLVRGTLEMPVSGLLLVIAALSVALAARDERGVWDAISATSSVQEPKERRSGGAHDPKLG